MNTAKINIGNEINNLALMICKRDEAWTSLLDSVGVPWMMCQDEKSYVDSSIFILPRDAARWMQSMAESFLARGGSVIKEVDPPFASASSDTDRIFFPYHRKSFSKLANDKSPECLEVSINHTNGGSVFSLPFELKRVWCDRRVQRQYICTDESERPCVWENLPAIARKNVRQVIKDVLIMAFHAAGLPFVHKWYWPGKARSAFCFRADMDEGNDRSLLSFIEAVRPWANSLSMFVCGQAYQGKLDLLRCVKDICPEIGNHTYTHFVYKDREQNWINLELTERMLAKVDIEPKGFVGPASFWHSSMYDALQEKGYLYTSSFGLDHDNFPYFPLRSSGGQYDMVELPFFCLGDMFPKFGLELGSPIVGEFFSQIIQKKYEAGEPINIYGHPDMEKRLGDFPGLIEKLCESALSHSDVWTGSMRDLALWWRERHNLKLGIEFETETRTIAYEVPRVSPVTLSVHTTDGRWGLFELSKHQGKFSLDNVKGLPKLVKPYATEIGEVVFESERRGIRQRVFSLRQSWKRSRRKHKELRMAWERMAKETK